MTDQNVKKTFLVKLEIQVNGYEKHAHHLIEADDVEQAEKIACQNETHNDDAGYDDYSGGWVDDDMIYRAYSIEEVQLDDVVTLRKYL